MTKMIYLDSKFSSILMKNGKNLDYKFGKCKKLYTIIYLKNHYYCYF